jgi:hypothetical protein
MIIPPLSAWMILPKDCQTQTPAEDRQEESLTICLPNKTWESRPPPISVALQANNRRKKRTLPEHFAILVARQAPRYRYLVALLVTIMAQKIHFSKSLPARHHFRPQRFPQSLGRIDI